MPRFESAGRNRSDPATSRLLRAHELRQVGQADSEKQMARANLCAFQVRLARALAPVSRRNIPLVKSNVYRDRFRYICKTSEFFNRIEVTADDRNDLKDTDRRGD